MKALHRAALEYFRENLSIYMLVSAFFLTGILTGAFLVKLIEEGQFIELNATVSYFMERLSGETSGILAPAPLLKISLQKNIRFLLITWLLGLLSLGFPFTLFYLVFKGLALGFTVGFLVSRSSLKGVVFCLAAFLPHNFLFIPAYLAAAAMSTTFSILKLKNRLGRKKLDLSHFFLQYCFFMLLVLILVVMGGLVEAYITPVFMRLAHSLLQL